METSAGALPSKIAAHNTPAWTNTSVVGKPSGVSFSGRNLSGSKASDDLSAFSQRNLSASLLKFMIWMFVCIGVQSRLEFMEIISCN